MECLPLAICSATVVVYTDLCQEYTVVLHTGGQNMSRLSGEEANHERTVFAGECPLMIPLDGASRSDLSPTRKCKDCGVIVLEGVGVRK